MYIEVVGIHEERLQRVPPIAQLIWQQGFNKLIGIC